MEEYPLTLEHVRQFLATKQDDDEIGICFNAMYCLLSETLNWLYPLRKPWRVDIGSYMAAFLPSFDLDEKVNDLRSAFDWSRSHKQDKTVTKACLREYLESVLADERYKPVSFAVADLFDVSANVAKEQVEW